MELNMSQLWHIAHNNAQNCDFISLTSFILYAT